MLAQTGAQVHFLCATRGEGGETGEPPVCAVEQLGEVREQELVCAVGALGGRSLTFLDYRDPRVGPGEELFAYTDDLTMLAGQVAATVRQFGIEAMITHGSNGEYGHPAHRITHQAALVAVLSFGEAAPLLYSVAASFPDLPRPLLSNADDEAHLVVDVSLALPHKEKAALCHRTQHALFVRRASEEAGQPLSILQVLMRVESLHRVHPLVDCEPQDALAGLLEPWKVKN